jgi:hypothetical protein
VAESDGAFEDVLVVAFFGDGGIGAGDVEEIAEFGEEELVVGAFGGGGILPALDEGVRAHLEASGSYGHGIERAFPDIYFTIDDAQCGGRPCIRGLRIRVADVLELLSAGASFGSRRR